MIKEKEILIAWIDAVLFTDNKPQKPVLKFHKGIITKEKEGYIIVKNPRKIIYSKNKIVVDKKFRPHFLFLPKGMILKIMSLKEAEKIITKTENKKVGK